MVFFLFMDNDGYMPKIMSHGLHPERLYKDQRTSPWYRSWKKEGKHLVWLLLYDLTINHGHYD